MASVSDVRAAERAQTRSQAGIPAVRARSHSPVRAVDLAGAAGVQYPELLGQHAESLVQSSALALQGRAFAGCFTEAENGLRTPLMPGKVGDPAVQVVQSGREAPQQMGELLPVAGGRTGTG